MKIRRQALGPMGRGDEYYIFHNNAIHTDMTLYFYDEVDAIDVKMMLDEMS